MLNVQWAFILWKKSSHWISLKMLHWTLFFYFAFRIYSLWKKSHRMISYHAKLEFTLCEKLSHWISLEFTLHEKLSHWMSLKRLCFASFLKFFLCEKWSCRIISHHFSHCRNAFIETLFFSFLWKNAHGMIICFSFVWSENSHCEKNCHIECFQKDSTKILFLELIHCE